MTIPEIINEFNQIKAKKELLEGSLSNKKQSLSSFKISYERMVKARWVLTEVAQQTQRRFQDKVEGLVTVAIRSVFDRPFEFHLEFERKRNRMECKPFISEGNKIYDDPEYDVGGGILDIISFAFRIVLWSLQTPRSRNVIVLDEPMKNMGKLIQLGGRVLKEISHKLGLQLIIVTHDEELIEIGDKVFRFAHDGVKSHIVQSPGEVVPEKKEKIHNDASGKAGEARPSKARIIR